MSRQTRRAHLDDYEPADEGGFAYTGAVWRWTSAGQRNAFLRRAAAHFASACACALGAGCLPLPGVSAIACALVPYALATIALGLTAASLMRLWRAKDALPDHTYVASVASLPARTMAGAVAASASAAGAIVCATATAGTTSMRICLAFAALMAGAAGLLGALHRHVKALPLKEQTSGK